MGDTAAFIRESNRIEGIKRRPTKSELDAHTRFMALDTIIVSDLEQFVSIYQPGAVLRDRVGLNVRVGNHHPPPGGPKIRAALLEILERLETDTPYRTHAAYEFLHPFTDGNGRSGRALWAWQMRRRYAGHPLGFLHHFYYQSLDANARQ